jgi:hypothetical protein
MKYLLLIWILPASLATVAQKTKPNKNFPFQVIYAESTTDKAGIALKSLDVVANNDILTVGKGGMLSMVHYTGYPIEVTGDTSLVLKTLQTLLAPAGNKRPVDFIGLFRPDLQYLFITDSELAKTSKASGACHDCDFIHEILYPPKGELHLPASARKDLCIQWRSTHAASYEVVVTNIFDDSLKSYVTNVNELTIGKEDMTTFFGSDGIFIIQVKDPARHKYSSSVTVRELPKRLDFPFDCNIEKPTIALLTALYLESFPTWSYTAEAEKYFKLATTLSDREFFKTMLNNFKKRTNRLD